MRFAVDVGGTFTDLVVEDGRACSFYKSPTTPRTPIEGVLDVLALAAPTTEWTSQALLSPGRHVHPRHDARDQRHPHRHHGADGLPHHRGPSRHPAVPRGRAHRAVQLHRALSRALRPARAHLRGPRADRRRRRGRAAARRGRGRRAIARPAAASAASRRSPSACSGRSSTRRTSCAVGELLARASAGRARHALAPAQPVAARVPPRLVDRDRRLAEAADVRLPRGLEERLREAGFARPAADGHLAGRRDGCRGDVAERADPRRSTPARRWRRSPAATMRGATPAPTRRSSPTPAAPPTTSAWSAAARIPWTRETWLGQPLPRPHDRLPLGRREEHRRRRRLIAWVDARRPAARRPAKRRRRSRARSATAAAATSRPSPTPRWCSATSTPTSSSAARMPLDRGAARAAIATQVARAARPRRSRTRRAPSSTLATENMVQRDRGDHRQPGHRPARGGARRRRRGGRPQRGRDRAPARLPRAC